MRVPPSGPQPRRCRLRPHRPEPGPGRRQRFSPPVGRAMMAVEPEGVPRKAACTAARCPRDAYKSNPARSATSGSPVHRDGVRRFCSATTRSRASIESLFNQSGVDSLPPERDSGRARRRERHRKRIPSIAVWPVQPSRYAELGETPSRSQHRSMPCRRRAATSSPALVPVERPLIAPLSRIEKDVARVRARLPWVSTPTVAVREPSRSRASPAIPTKGKTAPVESTRKRGCSIP